MQSRCQELFTQKGLETESELVHPAIKNRLNATRENWRHRKREKAHPSSSGGSGLNDVDSALTGVAHATSAGRSVMSISAIVRGPHR